MSKLTASDYRKRDEAIVKHMGRYQVTTKQIISKLFYDGKECGHVLKRMEQDGLIQQVAKGASGGFTYAMITPKGAAKAAVPKERGTHTQQSIDKNLGLVFACTLASDSRRHRLENSEVNQLLAAKGLIPPNVDFIAAEASEFAAVYRVYWAENLRSALSGLSELKSTFDKTPVIKQAIADGVFGVAVCCRTPDLLNRLQSDLNSARNPLSKDCHWFTALAPGVGELADAMKWYRVQCSRDALVAS